MQNPARTGGVFRFRPMPYPSVLPARPAPGRPAGARFFLARPRPIGHNRAMTNRLAVILFALVAAAIVADLALNQGRALLFLGKELFEFLDWIAFWR